MSDANMPLYPNVSYLPAPTTELSPPDFTIEHEQLTLISPRVVVLIPNVRLIRRTWREQLLSKLRLPDGTAVWSPFHTHRPEQQKSQMRSGVAYLTRSDYLHYQALREARAYREAQMPSPPLSGEEGEKSNESR